MKFFAFLITCGVLASSVCFADGEVICTMGSDTTWAQTSPINTRIKELEKAGKHVTVSPPAITVDQRAQGDDRLCVTLSY